MAAACKSKGANLTLSSVMRATADGVALSLYATTATIVSAAPTSSAAPAASRCGIARRCEAPSAAAMGFLKLEFYSEGSGQMAGRGRTRVLGVLLSAVCGLVLAGWLVPARRDALLATQSQGEANLAAQVHFPPSSGLGEPPPSNGPAKLPACLSWRLTDGVGVLQGLAEVWHAIDQRGSEQSRAHSHTAGHGGSPEGKRAVEAAALGSMGGDGLLGLASSANPSPKSLKPSNPHPHARKTYYSSSSLGASKWDANGTKGYPFLFLSHLSRHGLSPYPRPRPSLAADPAAHPCSAPRVARSPVMCSVRVSQGCPNPVEKRLCAGSLAGGARGRSATAACVASC